MPDKILVTGATGFIGSYICQYFGQLGYTIIGVGRCSSHFMSPALYLNLQKFYEIDLPDDSFSGIIKEFQPDFIIHCAGGASVPHSVREPYNDFKKSVCVTAHILESLRQYSRSCHFIFLSSAAVYGNPENLPVKEDEPCQPISPYGYHKYMCELLCQEYASFYGRNSTIVRIFSAYGEGLRKQVIFDLCKKFTDSSSQVVEVYGTGSETRDFIHAVDIARAVERICAQGATGVFNVGSGSQIKIEQIAEMIKDSLCSTKPILYNGSSRPGDPLYWQADISKLNALGFQPAISIQEGIKKYCDWFRTENGVGYDQ